VNIRCCGRSLTEPLRPTAGLPAAWETCGRHLGGVGRPAPNLGSSAGSFISRAQPERRRDGPHDLAHDHQGRRLDREDPPRAPERSDGRRPVAILGSLCAVRRGWGFARAAGSDVRGHGHLLPPRSDPRRYLSAPGRQVRAPRFTPMSRGGSIDQVCPKSSPPSTLDPPVLSGTLTPGGRNQISY